MKKHRLKILFDANSLMGNRTGIGHYTARLVHNMASAHPDDMEFVGYYYNFLGRKKAPEPPKAANIRYRPILYVPGPVVNLLRRFGIEVPVELLTLTRSDFVLYPNFLSHPSLFRTPMATVIHDLTFRDYPASGSDKNIRDLNRFVPRALKRSSFIMTVSEFSKARIMDTYGIPGDSIVTTFIPPQPPLLLPEAERRQLLSRRGIVKPYLFFLGTMEPRKNIKTLLDAYARLPEELRATYSLVLAGKIDWKYQETKDKLEKLQQEGYDIHYLGYIDDRTQAALYQGTRLCVLPSLYEGFGMQILESLSYGAPCAVSDIPVFHEVGGDAVTYFDHTDSAKVAQALADCLQSKRPDAKRLQGYISTRPTWNEVSAGLAERIHKTLGSNQDE